MHPRSIIQASIVVAVAAMPGLLQAKPAPLAGQWKFQTATGSSTVNGVAVDLIDTGLLDVVQGADGMTATISWLDERGQIVSTRSVKGQPGASGVVFRHPGKQTSSGRAGTSSSVDITVRWTLQAQGDILSGERLVETDANEPRPVTGIRLAQRYVAPPLPPAAPAASTERGPSTAEERARVVRMALDAQAAPQQVQLRDGAWLRTWVDEIPDLTLNASVLDGWLRSAPQAAIRDTLVFQYLASVMAFQITHPALAAQQRDNDLAGMQGVLRAYETLVRQNAAYRSPKLDLALAARDGGRLSAFVRALSGREVPLAGAVSRSADPQVRRIVALGMSEARSMAWLDILSNRFGGRMAGSDAYTHAAQWARSQLQQWGLQAELEPAGQMALGFNRGPWSARMLAQDHEQPLRIATPAYSAGTLGVQQGLAIKGPATLEEANARAAQFKGKWVLIGGSSDGTGRDGEFVHRRKAIFQALMTAGALGTIQAGEEPLYSAGAAPTSWDALPTLPDIKLAASQYADINARLASGAAVTLEFDIRNWFYPGPVVYHNVVAQIPGTDPAGEIVLLGAHLDSFDGGTGAADNGAGVASMMEAMRLLARSGVKPRRTIMMVAFGAEELGRKGSFSFAERHAGQLDKMVMMLNRDGRPGAINGITIPSAWKGVFARVERDLEGVHPVFGFTPALSDQPRDAVKAMNAGSGSDEAVFAVKGVPTPKFSTLSDFDYGQVLHTVRDTYDNLLPFGAAQQYSAVAIAVTAYEAANAPEELSRKGYYVDQK